jgi:hypothetical protein
MTKILCLATGEKVRLRLGFFEFLGAIGLRFFIWRLLLGWIAKFKKSGLQLRLRSLVNLWLRSLQGLLTYFSLSFLSNNYSVITLLP